MKQRIAVFGAECSGKTTLAQQLAAHFAEPWAAEFVRDFWHARHGDIRAQHLATVAQGQIDNEETAAASADKLVFCDTDLITNTLWADLLFPGHCPAWVRQAAALRCRDYALYLLCDNDIPFVHDVVRSFPEPEKRAHGRGLWRTALVDRGLPFVDIRGGFGQRFATALAAVERVIAGPAGW